MSEQTDKRRAEMEAYLGEKCMCGHRRNQHSVEIDLDGHCLASGHGAGGRCTCGRFRPVNPTPAPVPKQDEAQIEGIGLGLPPKISINGRTYFASEMFPIESISALTLGIGAKYKGKVIDARQLMLYYPWAEVKRPVGQERRRAQIKAIRDAVDYWLRMDPMSKDAFSADGAAYVLIKLIELEDSQ